MRFLSGFLVALGLAGLGLVLIGDLQVDLHIRLGWPERPNSVAKPLVLHQGDNGKTVSVRVGQEVILDLGTGYGAPYSSNPQVLAPVGETTPPYAAQGGSGGGSAVGGSTGAGSTSGDAGKSNFYCGILPNPPSTKPNCTPPCYCGTNCGSVQGGSGETPGGNSGTPMICCQPNSGKSYCPQPCPCGAYCPAIGKPTNPEAPSAGHSNVYCPPPCYCNIYCAVPMTGKIAPGDSTKQGSSGTGTSSFYCPPDCNCQTYCMDPRMGQPAHATPAQSQPGAASPTQPKPVYGSPSAVPGYTVAQSDMPTISSCGHGVWRAMEAGKADILVTGGPICNAIPCPMAGNFPVRIDFVVHVVVRR